MRNRNIFFAEIQNRPIFTALTTKFLNSMKKFLLSSILGLSVLASSEAMAQTKSSAERTVARENFATPTKKINTSKTRAGSRWYDPLEATLNYRNGDTTGLDANTGTTFLWIDSTMRVRYTYANNTTALGGIFLKSHAQILDPWAARFNNHVKVPGYIGQIAIRPQDAYTIDSVAVAGFYRRLSTKANIVDTLIVSVSYGNLSGASNLPGQYVLTAANAADVVASNCYNVDTMRVGALVHNPLTNGIQQTPGTGANVITKKIPLFPADSGGRYFYTNINLSVPAGNLAAMSYVFKSGDTWIPNVDSVSDFNFFRAFYTEEQLGELAMYEKRDYNSTLSMETDTTGWGYDFVPNFFYIGASGCSKTFTREQYWTLWKLSTTTNGTVGTIDQFVAGNESNVYPNPASDNVTVELTLSESAENVGITFTNALGQVVKTQSIGRVQANIENKTTVNVNNLSSGVYFYTIHADGKKTTGKLMVK
jgi:hypothetical protein